MWKPICQLCAAGVQLFKWCRNLSAGTVYKGCSCLSGVETYLPALCSRAADFNWYCNLSAGHCDAKVQLFKRSGNLSADTVLQLFKWCPNLSAGTVLQGCSCLSGVKTYLPALCCRGAAV